MAVLIGMSAGVRNKQFEIQQDLCSIGRGEGNAVSIDDPTVSGRHCSITREDRKYILRDLGSTNGTRVNARDVQEIALKPKDLIQVGSVEFIFDASPGEHIDSPRVTDTQVLVSDGPVAPPATFGSISPFGPARSEGSKGVWLLIIAIVGLAALAVAVFFFFTLIKTG